MSQARPDRPEDPIEAYLQDFARAITVRGTVRTRRRIAGSTVQEVRDHLVDSAEAYAASGLGRTAARHRAVADFGTVHELAPFYLETLHTRAAVRATAALGLVFAINGIGWQLISGETGQGAFAVIVSLLDVIARAGIGVCIALVGVGYLLDRRAVSRLRLSTLSSMLSLCCCVFVVALATSLNVMAPNPLDALITVALVGLPFGAVAIQGIRALSYASDIPHGSRSCDQ